MKRGAARRLLTIAAVTLGLFGAGALALADFKRPPSVGPRPAAERPALLLLTSLPIIFSEDFSLEGGGSPALQALETRYSVVPIATTDATSLKRARLLLMAHPQAQTAENLVALDQWVRNGGRLLLLADPKLDWPSELPLGHKLRPPPGFADTGLLGHWGLTLAKRDVDGRMSAEVVPNFVVFSSPGELQDAAGANCILVAEAILARCRVGRGEVTVIADADWLNVDWIRDTDRQANLELLLAEIDALER